MMPVVSIVCNKEPIDEQTFRFLLLFSPQEKQQRILRQRIKQNADTVLVGAALASHLLFETFRIPFSKQHIAYGPYGKPYLRDYPDVHFNISHSGIYVACAVADHPVGIDIQMISEYRPNVADRVCSKVELATIAASENPAAEFTKLWTRKEAYAKWTGEGIGKIVSSIEQMNHVYLKTYSLKGAFLSIVYYPY